MAKHWCFLCILCCAVLCSVVAQLSAPLQMNFKTRLKDFLTQTFFHHNIMITLRNCCVL